MANTTNPRRNAEGYPDPTAYCELADFEIEGRIILVDKRNGRVWR